MKPGTAVELSEAIDRLRDSAADYLCLDDHGQGHGHILFCGSYQGQEVVWDCHIWPQCTDTHEQAPEARQYIEIPLPENTLAQRIDIGLNISEIDTPTLLKTIIMVRQYRNLSPGRHQWK